MIIRIDKIAICRLIFTIAMGTAAASPITAQMALPKIAPASGGKLFGQQCGACHSTDPGETRVGPSLANVVGRKAGSVAGYTYSSALQKSGITWNAANLDRWLSGTQAFVSGTKMTFAQADATKRKALIDYLASLSK